MKSYKTKKNSIMVKINANSIRIGNIIEHKGRLCSVVKKAHTQPGKGGAYIQLELKDIKSGTKLNERFRSSENIERARLDQNTYQFLFREEDLLTLMDNTSYEQIQVDASLAGESVIFLQDGMELTLESYEDENMSIILPETVILEVAETEAVVKGQTAASSNKPAVMDNGVRVMVPPFIDVGDKLVVRTEDSEYLERAK
jgi:elongation factor P